MVWLQTLKTSKFMLNTYANECNACMVNLGKISSTYQGKYQFHKLVIQFQVQDFVQHRFSRHSLVQDLYMIEFLSEHLPHMGRDKQTILSIVYNRHSL